jgi:hypothetical protein
MKTPRMNSEHACPMPKPSRKHEHAIYVCECRCGWSTVYAFHDFARRLTWKWVQVL